MNRDRSMLLAGLLALALAGPARAGEEFVAAPPDNFTCKNFALDKTEHESDANGKKLNFTIWVTGICAPVEQGSLPSGGWKHVTAKGTYDYVTGKASEDVVLTADNWTAVQLRTSCSSNPWAHAPSCAAPNPLANNTGMELPGPFPISAHLLPPHLRQALAEWETSKTNSQLLADWNPLGPAQQEVLVIQKPGYSVPDSGSFEVALNALHPEPGWVVELEWARIDPPKDPSIEIAGAWKYDKPANAPKQVPWSQFPKAVPIAGSFTAGEYAVRAKVKGMAENTWSNWKRFWVGGGPKVQITPAAIIPLGGGATKQFSLDQPGEVVTFGKGKMKRFDSAKPIASPVAHGPMQTRQGQLPPGTGPQNASGPKAGALAKPAVVRPSAALSIGTIAVAPVGPDGFIAQGAAVMLSVEVKNAGPADAPATSTVKLECIVKSGGACPVASHTQPVGKSIPAGSSRSFTLVSASPSQPGTYQVRITPVNGGRGSGGQVDLKVKGTQVSPAAAGKINRNLGAQPQGAGQIQRVPAATPPAMQPADKNENGASHNEMLRVPAAKPVEPTR